MQRKRGIRESMEPDRSGDTEGCRGTLRDTKGRRGTQRDTEGHGGTQRLTGGGETDFG